jgi:cysteine desulfurase/selenocysteine lyase
MATAAKLDVAALRKDFPILSRTVRGRPLVYLDNAATTQKPQCVLEAILAYYRNDNANIHRGVHELSERATEAYEAARGKLRRFLNAESTQEIVFVRGATEGINLVAQSWGRTAVGPGDEIILSHLEHHSNIVPWQMLREEKGALIRVIPVFDDGELDIEAYERMLGPRTKIVAVTHVSNALGTITPVRRIIEMARRWGAAVLIDGAQAVAHLRVDVRELDCDFYVLSGHKLYGPTGIGVLYGKAERLEAMPPYQGGGDMIESVTFERTTYNALPYKFEAGTPHIAGAVGLGAAVDYLEQIGLESIAAHEHELVDYATQALGEVPGLKILGTAREKAAVISFTLEGVHPHDVGTVLDQQGIAVRTGHHCAQPVMERFGVPATTRASFALYNTREEVDALLAGLRYVREVFDL